MSQASNAFRLHDKVPVAPQSPGEFYHLRQFLGRGAYGEVWVAEAPGGVEVALKIIPRTLKRDESQRELEALHVIKRLRHPFLLSLQAFYSLEDRLIIVFELADSNLRARLDHCRESGQAGIPPRELLGYFREAAEALDFLHQRQLQHRDIKPDNLLVLGSHVKVADYGLARILDEGTLQTASTVGTPAYMAPEVWSQKISPHSDQYSLAVTYAELRTGRLPFGSRNLAQLVKGHLEDDPDLAAAPPKEQGILKRALAKEPAQRFATCSDFICALQEAAGVESAPAIHVVETPPAPTKASHDTIASKSPHHNTSTESSRPPRNLWQRDSSAAPKRPLPVSLALACLALAAFGLIGWNVFFADAPKAEADASLQAEFQAVKAQRDQAVVEKDEAEHARTAAAAREAEALQLAELEKHKRAKAEAWAKESAEKSSEALQAALLEEKKRKQAEESLSKISTQQTSVVAELALEKKKRLDAETLVNQEEKKRSLAESEAKREKELRLKIEQSEKTWRADYNNAQARANQLQDKLELSRKAALEIQGALALENRSDMQKINYKCRWQLWDGEWTPWQSETLEKNQRVHHVKQGAIWFQLRHEANPGQPETEWSKDNLPLEIFFAEKKLAYEDVRAAYFFTLDPKTKQLRLRDSIGVLQSKMKEAQKAASEMQAAVFLENRSVDSVSYKFRWQLYDGEWTPWQVETVEKTRGALHQKIGAIWFQLALQETAGQAQDYWKKYDLGLEIFHAERKLDPSVIRAAYLFSYDANKVTLHWSRGDTPAALDSKLKALPKGAPK